MGDTNFDAVVAATFAGELIGSLNFETTTATATATGATTGTIAAAGLLQFVAVTSGNADHIIVLPAPTPGAIVVLGEAGTGYELRASDPAAVAINGNTPTAAFESAIAADSMVFVVCTSATTWQGISTAGAVLAAVEAANNT